MHRAIWIEGPTRSGKTQQLITLIQQWCQAKAPQELALGQPTALLLVANGDNRRQLLDRLAQQWGDTFAPRCYTPLGWLREEVLLFWPLLVEQHPGLGAIPLVLTLQMEQALAIPVWQAFFDLGEEDMGSPAEVRRVRETLDLMQLAGAAGKALESLEDLLTMGLPDYLAQGLPVAQRQAFLLHWRQWCWQRGFLPDGITLEFYWRFLLPHPRYQASLKERFEALFADDVDDYPAIIGDLFRQLRPCLHTSALTFNRDGAVRLGLDVDPEAFTDLATWGERLELEQGNGLARTFGSTLLALIQNPQTNDPLPPVIQSIQTTSRANLLRETAEFIIEAIQQGQVQPQEIAIIAPGLDEVARYTLLEILGAAKIAIAPLNEQRPLNSSPLIRALLTLLALVYPGLGQWALRDEVAEMLVLLSQFPQVTPAASPSVQAAIDPVRAGLLADTCYQLSPDHPRLLPETSYARWDRFGYRATQAYQKLYQWIERYRQDCQGTTPPSPLAILYQAIEDLVLPKSCLSYAQAMELSTLQKTTYHFQQIQDRLQTEPPLTQAQRAGQLIQFIRQGLVNAPSRPPHYFDHPPNQVLLATVYHYRSLRQQHRWQIWLDVGDNLWSKGGAAKFAAPLFQRYRPPGPWTEAEELAFNQDRFERLIQDLLGRVTERLILCHSDFGVRGTEQTGALLALVQRSGLVEAQRNLSLA
ncbi:hypothetical protein [Synechocystis sp. LKSZ1]|uniref:hypothetical protein n=1 Tax=Synechocystis sp. LKSZ1 TaxID=3144951 RepID=UPI00336C2B1D